MTTNRKLYQRLAYHPEDRLHAKLDAIRADMQRETGVRAIQLAEVLARVIDGEMQRRRLQLPAEAPREG